MLKQIIKIHLLSLLIFSIFRIILILSNPTQWEGVSVQLLQALLMGVRFDNVVNNYILALPTLLWTAMYCVGRNIRWVNKALYVYCVVLFSVAYMVSAFDIPYFNQFFSRLDKMAFQWIDSPMFILQMAVKDFSLWGYVLPFIALMTVFHIFLRRIFRKIDKADFRSRHLPIRIMASLLLIAVSFLGIRGRWERKSPIRVGTAFFCNNAFLNKTGLNPNFTLLHSLIKKEKKWKDLMPTEKALEKVRHDLGIGTPTEGSLEVEVVPDSARALGKPNFVLVLMESMTTDNLKYFGNTKNLTPVLDSLIRQSVFFENAYSAGIHTYNGVYSSLFSFPAFWDEHAMKSSVHTHEHSSVQALRENGYTTLYLTTHDGQFDNIEGFLNYNGFDRVYTQSNYPRSEVHSNLGVSDDYLFRFGIKRLNELHKEGKPFFCTMMTASNHVPIIIPDYFSSPLQKPEEKVIQYADWAIGEFLREAEKEEWFRNTVFVFIADHGAGYDKTYEMSLSYNHVPLLFYAPHLLTQAEVRSEFALQIDVLPTLLGLTDISYTKNNPGIDLWRQQRPFAYFGADDKIGVVNDEYFLIYRKDGQEGLYKYRTKDRANHAQQQPALVEEMKEYAFSHIQAAYKIKTQFK